ncbi:MAG TPA: signal peptide peptidase SppA, partial [Saprospiraceae bacterium]|nr:signal peptide peptidase SppA [Saprospiraceae bacterium]
TVPEHTNNLPMPLFDPKQQRVLGLTDMVAAIRRAKDDPDIKGIFMNADAVMAGKATSATLRQALLDFRTSRKFVVAYAHFYTQGAYYLASAADTVILNPVGAVDFRGYSSQVAYFKGLLDKMDVETQVFYAGQFKSATEPFRSDRMSPQNRMQVREYLTALNNIMMRDIAASRNIPEPELRQIADRFDGLSAEKARRSRLVDRLAHQDEAFNLMKSLIGLGEKDKLNRVSIEDYAAAKGKTGTDYSIKDKVAVVYAEGSINDGEETEAGDIYDEKYIKILRQIRKNDNIKAVVLRINSPGGSVLASENILREVQLCRQANKPVVVSMGDVAASGGYYIACQADSIFAEPATITGSIGVFGIIPMLDKTMKNKLGITYDTVRTGKFSAFGSPFIAFSEEEKGLIQGRIDATYEDFLHKVAKGRQMTRDEVHQVAQGRVWSGEAAKSVGLVDEIGGLDRAIASAARLAKLDKYRRSEYPEARSGWEQLLDRLKRKGGKTDEDVKAWLVRTELGDMYPTYQLLRDAQRQRGTIQVRLPWALEIR